MNDERNLTGSENILIIGDAWPDLDQLTALLSKHGYSVKRVSDRLAASTLIGSTGPDLILLAVAEPHSYEICQSLRANEETCNIPVIFIVTHNEQFDRANIFTVAGADYLLYPFQEEEILARVKQQITHRRLARELQLAKETMEQRVTERTGALTQTVRLLEEQVNERKRAEAALQQYADLLGVLHQIDQAILAAQSPEAIAQGTLGPIRQLVPCERASLTLFDFEAAEAVLLAVNEGRKTELKRAEHLPLAAFGNIDDLRQGQPLVDNLSGLTNRVLIDEQLWALGLESRIHAPLVSRDKLTGCLTLAAKTPNVFSVQHAAIAHEIAAQLAVALENARLHTETQQRAKQLNAVNKANRVMASTLDLDIVLKQVMAEVKTLLNVEGASVLLHDPVSNELFFSTVVAPDAEALAGMRLPLTEGIAGWVMKERQAVLVDDVQHDSRFYDRIDDVTGLTTQSLLAVPLIYKDKVIGVVEAINKAGERFTQQDLELLEALTSSAAIAIENARLYKDLQDRMRALQETQTQLIQSEKMAALGRLVASITHEINNPLQSVQTCLTLTKEELNSSRRPEKIERYLDIVESEMQRVSTIVRRMRDFYRPAANQGLQPVNLRQLLENVLELTGKQLQHSDIVIEGIWSKSLPNIQANADHLKQVFLNLILNAIDAMPQGGTLYISTRPGKLYLNNNQPPLPAARIEFRDTGLGMSSEMLTHLFEPFFTTKPHGSGLGLCISYNIIEAHNGQITVNSELNKGTTFTILLPLEQPESIAESRLQEDL